MLKVKIDKKELEFSNPDELLENSSPKDIKKLFSLIPKMTQFQFINWITEMNKKRSLLIWKRNLEEKKKRTHFNKEDIDSIVETWNNIINEYLDFKYMLDLGIVIPGTKIHKFDIRELYLKLKHKDNLKNELAYRLIDVKFYQCFDWNIMFDQYKDTFKIIGNNDLLEITPEAMNWMNGVTYRISLLSILIEKSLDLIEFVYLGKIKDHKKGKWAKKLDVISNFIEISDFEKKQILDFKESYRTAELHKMSSVRAMTSKPKWISVKEEEDLINDILKRFYDLVMK